VTDREAAERQSGIGGWVVMPILILLFAAVYLALFSPVIGWALGGGTPGTFTAQFMDCHHGCAWFGEFRSGDQKLSVQNAQFVNVNRMPGIRAGTVIRVVDISSPLDHGDAYPRHPALRDLFASPLLIAVLLGLLPVILFLLWIWTVPLRYCRRHLRSAAGRAG
jgi:hypothetical protein